MKDSVLQKYTGGKQAVPEPTLADESDGLDDLGTFGFLRGVRDRAIMLELRHRDGSVTALGYAWLSKSVFDPSEGITLHFGAETIKITGRNLNSEIRPNVRMFAAIVRHRVPWIQEADEPTALEAPRNATVIEQVEIK
jgi:hypothetical protein